MPKRPAEISHFDLALQRCIQWDEAIDRLQPLAARYVQWPTGPARAHWHELDSRGLVEWMLRRGPLSCDADERAFFEACDKLDITLNEAGHRRREKLEEGAIPAPVESGVRAGEKQPAQQTKAFSGCSCADIHVTVRMDGLTVKPVASRGLGSHYPLAEIGITPGDLRHTSLMEMAKSTAAQNMVPYPTAMSDYIQSRFCKAFRNATGVSDNLLSRAGKTLISNAGGMSWDCGTQSGRRHERSNQQERIDRTAAE